MRRIRWKIVFLIFISAGLAAWTTFMLAFGVIYLYYNDALPFRAVFLLLEHQFGVWPIAWTIGIVLFVIYVVLLSLRPIRYLEEIGTAVQRLSKGELDYQVPVRTKDEMGRLADNINEMATRLKASMEEERQAVQAKQELITNVSHDLRTPLTSIKGYLQYINENRYKDEVELIYYSDIAYQKALRLERMVNDLFEYTRVAYGQSPLKVSFIDLGELMGQLCAELKLMVDEAGVELRLEIPQDERFSIQADGDKLVRVFENLIANAISYGKDGKRIRVTLAKRNGMAEVRVINNGEPIPASELPYIFDRFHRVDRSRSDQGGGTGLGLAIARSIVELHRGSIEAASDAEETCFTVRLPLS